MNQQFIIAVDWGTSLLRAYLCRVNDCETLELHACAHGKGVAKLNGAFEKELFDNIAPWLNAYGNLPILMAGQIGSSIGWKETKYLGCPISPSAVASACHTFICREQQIAIVPGLHCSHDNQYRDVMRGEELQVLGWLAQKPEHMEGDHLVCLPGTHTKWVLVKNGKVTLFKTAMTGELYDLLSNGSVLIQQSAQHFNEAAFIDGAQYTLGSEFGSFSHGLFSVRSKQLFNELEQKHAKAYLSGLLLGTDVRAALNATEWQLNKNTLVHIIGNPTLADLFAKTLSLRDIKSVQYNVEEITLSGFSSLFQNLALHDVYKA
ncbi:2-dehydro-3-deoxygalactonokinase [Thalassotalea euphylliae]|uniref:2-dehydro-3-deoxygalactonokinase n=1 Tax=Thalassotalea euphylliae TaxID=1655234 RepID=UPI0036348570